MRGQSWWTRRRVDGARPPSAFRVAFGSALGWFFGQLVFVLSPALVVLLLTMCTGSQGAPHSAVAPRSSPTAKVLATASARSATGGPGAGWCCEASSVEGHKARSGVKGQSPFALGGRP